MISENDDVLQETDEQEDMTKNLYLCFHSGDEEYAVEVTHVKEIVKIKPITVVPNTPDFVKGIINLRGDIVPVIDIRARFMKPEIQYDEDITCIVILQDEVYNIGLIVDKVSGVLKIESEDISPPPSAKLSYANMFVKSIAKTNDGLKLLLDLEKVVGE